MSLIKLGIILGLLMNFVSAWAKTTSVEMSYLSWREAMKTSSSQSRMGTASFAGFKVGSTLGFEIRKVNFELGGGFFIGGGDARSADLTTYISNRQRAQGVFGTGNLILSSREGVKIKAGFDFLAKQVTWPTTEQGVNVNTALLNLGPTLSIDYMLFEQWFFMQKIGTYSVNGEAFWQLGMSYSY